MKQFLVFFWLLYSTLSIVAQPTVDATIAIVNGRSISRNEFVYAYEKNKAISGQSSLSPQEYLNLYIDYQLKLSDALSLGLDTTKSFRREFHQYRDLQLSKKLVSPLYIDSIARTIYLKEKQQLGEKDLLNVSHILLTIPSTATSTQRDHVAQRADSLYQAIISGANFEDIARRFSEDRGTAQEGGRLPTIYPGMTVASFEEVVRLVA